MNISVNVDCTPEEARRFMGLPDMAPVHQLYLDKLREAMSGGLGPDAMESMIRAWAPMGEAGLGAWRQLVDQMTGTAKG